MSQVYGDTNSICQLVLLAQLSRGLKWTINYVLSTYYDYDQVVNPLVQP